MNESKFCPLLNMFPESTDAWCIGPLCAWYIPSGYPKLQPEGQCAMVFLAGISERLRNI